jgi:FkbM family methyltransferase
MKRKGNFIRLILFRLLSFEGYLYVLSKLYFITFSLGLLRNSELYEYPYFLRQIIRKGDVVIDIGANLGYLTRLFSKLVKNEGRVYAVEPVEPVLNVLRKNTRGLKNVEIYPYALGTENKTIFLGNDTKIKKGFIASGSNFILDEAVTGKNKADVEFSAEMKKGSELFENLSRLDFIKIDVEGYEKVIISEMESLIVRFKPVMLVETKKERRKEIIRFLNERAYKPFVLHNNLLYPADENGYKDILFVPEARMNLVTKYISD